MCTLIAFHRVWSDAPLVVATNRDEAWDRPSAPPRWRDWDPAALAPLDERAGGTWMGATRRGLWVGLTNRRGGRSLRQPRSRGLLCRDLLRAASAEDVASRLASLAEPYEPFHVVAADAERIVRVEHESGTSEVRFLRAGCHIVTNRPADEHAEEPKARRSWRLLYESGLWPAERGTRSPRDLVDRLARILADHGSEDPDALCLHGDRYGTRSAAIWRIAWPGAAAAEADVRLSFADGPPCTTPFGAVGGARVDGPEAPG